MLRFPWDNGDRTILVNPEVSGITIGWRLTHTAQDELFAAIEGAAFHTRVILEHMEQHGVPIRRVINGGGIPQRNNVLNQVYANVLNKPVLVPADDVTSLGSAIFAFLAAGTFNTIAEAQNALCPALQNLRAATRNPRRLRRALRASSANSTTRSVTATVMPAIRRIAAAARGARMLDHSANRSSKPISHWCAADSSSTPSATPAASTANTASSSSSPAASLTSA